MARLAPTSYQFPEVDYRSKLPYDQWPDHVELMRLLDISKNLDLSKGSVVGAVLSWPIADGCAYYLVIKDSPLTLQHLNYGDAWHVDPVLIRGLRKQDVVARVTQAQRLSALFSK